MPTRQRITFPNQSGDQLAAALELPDRQPRAYAIFAHCFTCGKDIAAATRISRTLAASGFAVLRFDFTGLGGSEGDFGNTNFTSNVEDLVSAADYLRREHAAPQLLIGHSLGGTAMLRAAAQIGESAAVVTIGAPAAPAHVIGQFAAQTDVIETAGSAQVELGGKVFSISRDFLNDAKANTVLSGLANLKKALLVLHAPFDAIVPVSQATEIFGAAKHPKSFVSLDNADHLVSKIEDAQYVADVISAWSKRYITAPASDSSPEVAGGEVFIDEGNLRFLRHVSSDDHAWLADEPKRVGGDNLGPDPYEHLLASLGTCTSMTIRMYANRKKIPLESVRVQLRHTREHAEDSAESDVRNNQMDKLQREISFTGSLDDAQRARLMQIADRCPVHKTLVGDLRIETIESPI